jgi:hypothetical protein
MEKARPGSIVLLHTPDLREAHDRRNNVQVFRESMQGKLNRKKQGPTVKKKLPY